MRQQMMVMAHLGTRDGFNFLVMIKNEGEHTYFGCPGWRVLAKAYKLDVGMKIKMYILGQPKLDIIVRISNAPVLPPSYFMASDEIQNIVDKRHVTTGTTLTWQELDAVVDFVQSIEEFVEEYDVGPYDGSFVSFVHTLNKSNVKKPQLKLPKHVVPVQMQAESSGDMRLVVYDETDIPCTYSTSSEDGCLIVNGWKEICHSSKKKLRCFNQKLHSLTSPHSTAVILIDV